MTDGKHELGREEDELIVTSSITDEETGTPPHISAGARTKFYLGVLLVNVLTILVCGLGPIFGYMTGEQALAAGGVVTGALGTLSAGLALGYRPTRPGAAPLGG